MQPLRILLMEDGELIDTMSVFDTLKEAESYIQDEGVLGVSYYVVKLDECSVYHVQRELRTGKSKDE